MLIDEAKIEIKAGNGGNGAVSFRREKYVPRGGPDGGDGGDGGSVIIISSNNVDTLFEYSKNKIFKAKNGASGAKSQRTGKSGEDLILKVPTGTELYDAKSDQLIADLNHEGMQNTIARGGKGGLGNTHFKSATNQAPRQFKPGEPGEEIELRLSLKMVADVGIIGLPNAGKSTLISAISAARPKIAEYPFTTLEPNLGAVSYHDRNIIFCDIPGLIEGAAQGRGLGHKFLKHIERTKILLHLIDSTSNDLQKDYRTIRRELENFSPRLARKKELVVLSKIDLIDKLPNQFKYDLAISAATHRGLDKLLNKIAAEL